MERSHAIAANRNRILFFEMETNKKSEPDRKRGQISAKDFGGLPKLQSL
jgi:hypothetical protein